MEHHDLDIYPIPREKTALYINEPWLIDKSIMERVQLVTDLKKRPDEESDNIRIYVPLDLNRNAILRRLDSVIYHYGETNEENELDFSMDIEMIISQIEIYDQVWFGRHMPKNGKHSLEAKTLVLRTFRSFNRTQTTIVSVVYVSHLKSGTITRQTTRT